MPNKAEKPEETDAERETRIAKEKAADDAITAFRLADEHYKGEETALLRGDVIVAIVTDVVSGALQPGDCRATWLNEMDRIRNALEDRNAKLKVAQLALRDLVRIDEHDERGPGTAPTVIEKPPFKVNSVTSRGIDVPTLLHLAEKNEIKDKILALSTDKTGTTTPVLRQVWEVNVDYMMTWLKSHKYEGIINACYTEVEKTPQVSGPKPLAFIGTEMK